MTGVVISDGTRSKLFIFVGFILIFLGVVFCVEFSVNVQDGLNPDYESGRWYWPIGVLLGGWGLTTLLYGITCAPISRRDAFLCVLLILILVDIGTALLSWYITPEGFVFIFQ